MTSSALDATDRALIVATQEGLPLSAEPYREIAAELAISEHEVIARLRRLLERGIIRRIGAVPNHFRLGYVANGMTVWDVDDDHIDEVGRRVGALPVVSHCYRRPRALPDWPYNLFAMIHGHSREEVEAAAHTVAALIGPAARGHDILYSSRILKKTGLRLHG